MTPLLHVPSGKPLYVLRRISDKFIINGRALSNTAEGLPNPGPDQEYLPILIEDTPDNDPVYTIVTQSEGADAEEGATAWHIKYTVADRPLQERLTIAENAKRFEVQKHVPPQDFYEMVVLTLAAVLRAAKGLELTPDEQVKADKLVAVASRLSLNAVNAADIKAAIEAGGKPDLKAGWQEVSP